jgi:hypothetical protein
MPSPATSEEPMFDHDNADEHLLPLDSDDELPS